MDFLQVPFEDKDKAKSLGAKWDAQRKKWYIPDGIEKQPFEKWLPKYETEFNLRALSPFYLLKSKEPCWKCEHVSEVISFAAEGVEEENKLHAEFVTFFYVALLPERLKVFVTEKYASYFLDYSNTTESYYYINHCQKCSASLGDFFMHNEPGGAFFPLIKEAARDIELIELKDSGYVRLNASTSFSASSMIQDYAMKSKYSP